MATTIDQQTFECMHMRMRATETESLDTFEHQQWQSCIQNVLAAVIIWIDIFSILMLSASTACVCGTFSCPMPAGRLDACTSQMVPIRTSVCVCVFCKWVSSYVCVCACVNVLSYRSPDVFHLFECKIFVWPKLCWKHGRLNVVAKGRRNSPYPSCKMATKQRYSHLPLSNHASAHMHLTSFKFKSEHNSPRNKSKNVKLIRCICGLGCAIVVYRLL